SRVLWCGPTRPGPELLDLADRLEQALRRQGLAPETRPFRPHLTLARKVRRPTARAAASWGDPVEWTAPELILAAGRQEQVPRYLARRRWPLADSVEERA
ncbi:MAG: 2'-5' RNA ligase family protein, partial [Chromatiaceae bacterium]